MTPRIKTIAFIIISSWLFIVLPVKQLGAQVQSATDTSIKPAVTPTTLKLDTIYGKKRFWRASGELMLAQVVPWAYNYYVRDADFAHISWESIKHNIQFSNWEWDDNSFKTNQFAHPYHGGLYFSAFTAHWRKIPFTVTRFK